MTKEWLKKWLKNGYAVSSVVSSSVQCSRMTKKVVSIHSNGWK